ncbi:hypothetical protein KCU64_g8956, partial [Aureobasidium melanogenum]
MSFRFVEYPEFHELIAMFNPAATDVLIKSHTSVARHVERLYDLQQEQLKQALAQSRSKIHFTCDTWTSNYAALELLAVTARWVTPEGRLTKALLNLHNLPLGHAGLETAPRLIQTIKQFGITNPGYITSDNADCNDTMMKEMSEVLERDMGIIWDPVQHRTRCFGHQNNLILEAFWKTSSEEAIDAAVKNTSQPEAILDREESGWASEEAVRHLEWFMKTVKSKKRLNRLFRRETGLAPIANNATRWNSYYAMFERALLCRETITQLQMKHAELREFPLFPEHWRVIQYTFDFLKEFLLITKDAEGDNATVVIAMDFLRLHYDEAMARHAHDPSFLAALTSSRYAAEAWYGTNDRTPAYQAAILLHPSYRLSYVEQQWPTAWVKDAKDAVTRLWNREYRDKFTPPSAPTPPLESGQVEGGGTSFRNWKAGLMHVKAVVEAREVSSDEEEDEEDSEDEDSESDDEEIPVV